LATQHDATVDEPSADRFTQSALWAEFCRLSGRITGKSKSSSKGASAGSRFESNRTKTDVFRARSQVQSIDESGYRTDGLLQKIHTLVEQFCAFRPDAYTDALHASLRGISAAQIADAMSSHLRIAVDEKQQLLEMFSVQERLQRLAEILEQEIEKKQLDRTVHTRTKKQMDKHQREYYLNEQIKAIHKELGRKDDKAELDELKKKLKKPE
jgi:ATP-dependent Lon protease